MTKPVPRQRAPELDIDTLEGHWRLTSRQPDLFSMMVFYRGLHCPICKMSLRALDRKLEDFTERGVEIIVVSGDDRERAERTKSEWGLKRLEIGYGLTESAARDWGLYVSTGINDKEPERFFEPGLFLVRPNGELYSTSIQSMPFARPDFGEVLSAIEFIAEKDYPARGEA